MAQCVTKAAEECGTIVDTQMGRRKNYSAVDPLINISTSMSQSLRRRNKRQNPKTKYSKTLPRPSLLTHGIDGAFNNTDPEVLIQIMEQRRLPSYMILWVKAFTTDRKLEFGFDGKSEDPEPFNRALPQGTPISPTLFVITACAIFENQKHEIQITQKQDEFNTSYVDDISLKIR
jgi:hypothetical protein